MNTTTSRTSPESSLRSIPPVAHAEQPRTHRTFARRFATLRARCAAALFGVTLLFLASPGCSTWTDEHWSQFNDGFRRGFNWGMGMSDADGGAASRERPSLKLVNGQIFAVSHARTQADPTAVGRVSSPCL